MVTASRTLPSPCFVATSLTRLKRFAKELLSQGFPSEFTKTRSSDRLPAQYFAKISLASGFRVICLGR